MSEQVYKEQLNKERNTSRSRPKIKLKKQQSDSLSDITDVEFFLILLLAIFKDLLDWLLLIAGGIGLILSRLTNLIISGILWLWCLFRLKRFPTKRFLGAFFIEMIPLIGTFVPTWTIFIGSLIMEQKGLLPKWATSLIKLGKMKV